MFRFHLERSLQVIQVLVSRVQQKTVVF